MAKTAEAPQPEAKKTSGNGAAAAAAKTPATPEAKKAPVATEQSESDKAAETAMNAVAESPVTTVGSTEEISTTDETEIADDGSIKLPPNEFNFLTEVLKTKISKERYDELVAMKLIGTDEPMDKFFEVTAEIPETVFGDRASKKTLVQSAKTSLAKKRGVIKIVINGTPSDKQKTIIKLLREDFVLGKNGRSTTGKRRGRPPGTGTKPATVTATPGKRGRKSNAERAAAAQSNESETFAALRARLMPDPARIEGFLNALNGVQRKYPELFALAVTIKA